MAKFFSSSEIEESRLNSRKPGIIGYGNQGRAQALNLRDSGYEVMIGARPGGPSSARATSDGFSVVSLEEAAASCSIMMLSAPDLEITSIYEGISSRLAEGATVLVSHGFAVRFGKMKVRSDLGLALVAPKGAGARLRARYEQGSGLAGLIAVEQDPVGQALPDALAYASGIGCARIGLMETTFAEETDTDLFGEQAVLCGGLPELMKAAFDTLVEAGYQPEAAYFECIHEAKLIMDLIFAGSFASMRSRISDTAQFGGLVRGEDVIDSSTRVRMKAILERIQSGEFAQEWADENKNGRTRLLQLIEQEGSLPVEGTIAELFRAMPGLNS